MSKKTSNTKEQPKKITIPFSITWPKKGEGIKPTINTTKVLISGILLTCVMLSLVSGLIDLIFFSGLSKSWYTIATIKIAAGIVFSVMSLGFTSAKFWCAMQLGAINELQTRLKNDSYKWYKNLNKLKIKWHIAHKFLITVSLITSISLSVVSIGDAIRRNQNVIKRANDDIVKITKYYNTTDASDDVQFKALVSGTAASSTAASKAADLASKIWPIIEDYRTERAEFEAEFGNKFSSKDEVVWRGQTIVPDNYWDDQNSLVQKNISASYRLSLSQIRNITSEAALATRIKTEIEESVANSSLDELTTLADKTKTKAVQEIKNLEGRYSWPDGSEVIFDENNISGAINILSDVKAAYENDTGDVGESAKMFMLIGPQIENANKIKATSVEEAFDQDISVSSFGTTEVMMMVLIMIFGIVQEFLIALFTPKSTIDRKMLSRFDAYFGEDFNIDMFLLKVYKDYLKKGIISQNDFEAKAKKCVALMEDTVDDVILRYSKKAKAEAKELKSDKDVELLKDYYVNKIGDLQNNINVLDLNNKSKDKIIENLNAKIEELSTKQVENTEKQIVNREQQAIIDTVPDEKASIKNTIIENKTDNTKEDVSLDPGTIEIAEAIKKTENELPVRKVADAKLSKLNDVLNAFEEDLNNE